MRVGMFTSPHLIHPRDSIWVQNQPVSLAEYEHACQMVDDAALESVVDLTPFERLVCAAFWLFAWCRTEVVVLEVGMGGREDATNVGREFPYTLISAVTRLGLDHVAMLGGNIESIAKHKVGILKRRGCLVIGIQDGEFNYAAEHFARQECKTKHASCIIMKDSCSLLGNGDWEYDGVRFHPALLGDFQRENMG